MRIEGVVRREVLLPGVHLPDEFKDVGKHHGIVVRSETRRSVQVLHIKLTDFKNLKLELPYEIVRPHLLPKPERQPRPRWVPSPDKRPASALAKKPKKKHKYKIPEGVPLYGAPLQAHLKGLSTSCLSSQYPPGMRIWAKTSSNTKWPGVAWALGLCKQRDIGALVLSHRPGSMLIRFYGQHSLMWISEDKCELPPPPEDREGCEELLRQIRAWGRQHSKMNLVKVALEEMEGAHTHPAAEIKRMTAIYDAHLVQRMELDTCWLCRDGGASGLQCGNCDRRFHTLCLRSPAVNEDALPGGHWECPCCFTNQAVVDPAAKEAEGQEVDEDGQAERMGLTPDWLISAAAFQVFHLDRPTAHHRAQVQWRFVNRAIDEVENDNVPAVILVVRNSTDTAYFQRLRPYPRVMLRRTAAQFKDYNKAPPGFGIAVFCVAQHHKRELFADFVKAFESFGEPTIPFDINLLRTEEFFQQLERSAAYAAQHSRDQWVQCNKCSKWRIIDFVSAEVIKELDDWDCSLLRPPFSSCCTPLTRFEIAGGHYRARNVGEGLDDDKEVITYEHGEAGSSERKGTSGATSGAEELELGGTTSLLPLTTMAQVVPSQLPQDKSRSNVPEHPSVPSSSSPVIPRAAVMNAISVLPLRLLQTAATSTEKDAEIMTALELARQARIAANRAYLQHLGSMNRSSDEEIDALPCDHPAVLTAAREVARIAALQACAAQREKARQQYEHARQKRQQVEGELLASLEAVRQAEREAEWRWQAAARAATDILVELNRSVAVDTAT